MSCPSIGKIFGVEKKLTYTWYIISMLVTGTFAGDYMPSQYPGLPTLYYWLIGAISALTLFASVLFHKLAHFIVAKKRGYLCRA